MAISYIDGDIINTASADSVTITIPAGVQSGDFVIAFASTQRGSDQDLTESTGTWDQQADLYVNDTTDVNFGCFTKLMGGTPDASVTIQQPTGNNNPWVAGVRIYRGVDPTTPLDVASVTASSSNSPDPDPGAITTVTNDAVVVIIGASSEPLGTFTFPGDYGNTQQIQASNAAGSLAAADKLIATAGLEDPGILNFSGGNTGDSWAAVTLALRPDVGSGSTYTLTANAASYTYSATAASLEHGREVTADSASYAYTATAAGLNKGRTLVADGASYVYTATAAALEHGREVVAASASYAWNATAASLELGREVVADGASFAWTANAAALELGREVTAGSAAYAWTASDATLTYGATLTLGAESAAYVWGAGDADLIYTPVAEEEPTSGGSWGYRGYSFPRRQTEEELREERERLGILPKQQKQLARAARSIAKRVEPGQSPDEIAREIARAKEYDKLMAELTARNRAAIEGFALLVMQALQARILEELRDEDDAIAMLLLEM